MTDALDERDATRDAAVARSARIVGWAGVGCALASPLIFGVAIAVHYGSLWIAIAMLGLPLVALILGTDSRASAKSVAGGDTRPGTAALALAFSVLGGMLIVAVFFLLVLGSWDPQ